jgi:alpha-amylase/alpha-mannosidase (GH57 family)
MATSLVIHGHFYQPPRENPWTEVVEPEPSAAPFHDWNERIHKECYRANAHARIIGPDGRIAAMPWSSQGM